MRGEVTNPQNYKYTIMIGIVILGRRKLDQGGFETVNIYTGNDGAAAGLDAEAAIKSGKYTQVGRLVNPSHIMVTGESDRLVFRVSPSKPRPSVAEPPVDEFGDHPQGQRKKKAKQLADALAAGKSAAAQ
jgi:hypothetical protein